MLRIVGVPRNTYCVKWKLLCSFCLGETWRDLSLWVFSRGFFSSSDEGEAFENLPYVLDDLRQAGFLGRLVPRQHPDLGLPETVTRYLLSYSHFWAKLLSSFLIEESGTVAYSDSVCSGASIP